MSDALTPEPPARLTRGGLAALVLAACVIAGLQIALPCGSWWANRNLEAEDFDIYSNDSASFWQRRFRFEALFHPGAAHESNELIYTSSTVCGDEIVVLLKTPIYSDVIPTDQWSDPSEIVRINMRTGHVIRSPASAGVYHVLSDGRTLWLLPTTIVQPDATYRFEIAPFLRNGAPTIITENLNESDWFMFEYRQFRDGQWLPTGESPLIPYYAYRDLHYRVVNGEIQMLYPVYREEIYYRKGLELGHAETARESHELFAKRFYEFTDDDLAEIGWRHVKLSAHHFDRLENDGVRTYFFDGETPSAICTYEDYNKWNEYGQLQHGFLWFRYNSAEPEPIRIVPSPFPWPRLEFTPSYSNFVRLIISPEGNVYLVALSDVDGRAYVFRWDHGRFHLIAQRYGPLIWMVCLDGTLLFGLAFAIPMLLWNGLVWIVEHRQRRKLFSSGLKTVELATACRRGTARLIDLVLIMLPFLLAFLCHPDIIGWWRHVIDHDSEGLRLEFASFTSTRNVSRFFSQSADDLLRILVDVARVPHITWLLVASISLLTAQIFWQARTGYTLGKRFVGIRVLGTTLRPCGLARSLLREIYLLADSLCLVSWIPGVISILATERSQRLGDRFADTVVIRN